MCVCVCVLQAHIKTGTPSGESGQTFSAGLEAHRVQQQSGGGGGRGGERSMGQ